MAVLNKIVLVDDEPDIREVAKLALGAVGGFTVHTCDSGAAALAQIPGQQPDLVLLDVMMPAMDGPTLLLKLRETPNTRDIPVIFMTAKAQREEVEKLKNLGALGVITKPFDPMGLADVIRGIWQKGRSANE